MLRLHFIILIWGCTGVTGKLITLPAIEVVFFRCAIAAMALEAWLAWRRRQRSGTSEVASTTSMSMRTIVELLGVGILIGVHWVLFFAACNVANVSVAMVGLATTALWTAVLEPLMIPDRHWKPSEFVFGAITLLAIALIFLKEESELGLGFALGIAAALVAAVFSILNVRYTHDHNPVSISKWQMIGAALLGLSLFPFASWLAEPDKPLAIPGRDDWIGLLFLSLVCTAFAYVESVELLRRISVYTLVFANNLEPIYGIVLGGLLFGDHQHLTGYFYFGATLIVASVVIQAWWQHHARIKSERQAKLAVRAS